MAFIAYTTPIIITIFLRTIIILLLALSWIQSCVWSLHFFISLIIWLNNVFHQPLLCARCNLNCDFPIFNKLRCGAIGRKNRPKSTHNWGKYAIAFFLLRQLRAIIFHFRSINQIYSFALLVFFLSFPSDSIIWPRCLCYHLLPAAAAAYWLALIFLVVFSYANIVFPLSNDHQRCIYND